MLLTEKVKTKLQKKWCRWLVRLDKSIKHFGHQFETHVGRQWRHLVVLFATSPATYYVEHTISIKIKNLVLAHSMNTQTSNKRKKRPKKQCPKQDYIFKYFKQLRAKPVLDVICLRTYSPINTICWH